MCGLAGILFYPRERSPAEWAEIRRLFSQTLLYNQERGRDATGVALVRRDGRLQLFKLPVSADVLVGMEPYRRILADVGADTTCLLGHTRYPTKGSRWNNANNHPLLAGHTLGVHNGQIFNDDELFARLDLPREGEVDSEIIFRLLDGLDPMSTNGRYPGQVQECVRRLAGPFATLSLDLRRPTRLLALKHLRPLCFHYEPALQVVFFSSRYLFLRKAFGRSVLTEALEPNHGFVFDAESLPEWRGRPLETFALDFPSDPGPSSDDPAR